VWQRREQDVDRLQLLDAHKLKISLLPQVRVGLTHKLAGQPLRRHLLDRGVGVIEQQPDEFATAVPTSSNYRNLNHCELPSSNQSTHQSPRSPVITGRPPPPARPPAQFRIPRQHPPWPATQRQ